jgi:hypothetical protein
MSGMLSTWYLVVRGSDVDLARLKELFVTSAEHSLLDEKPGEWRLRSSTVESSSGPEVAWPALRELLGRLSDIAAAAADDRVRLTPGVLGRTRPDGHDDLFVFPEAAHLKLRTFPPTVAINGVMPEPRHVKLLRLEPTNQHLRLAMHFLNANLTWFDLWKAFEVIREACGGEKALADKGWTTRAEIVRFRHTANSYHAVGDEARHASPRHPPPSTPMSLDEADGFVRRLLARWVDGLP